MIDGITVMMTTQTLKVLREQVERDEAHSTIGVPKHLDELARESQLLASAIIANKTEKEAA